MGAPGACTRPEEQCCNQCCCGGRMNERRFDGMNNMRLEDRGYDTDGAYERGFDTGRSYDRLEYQGDNLYHGTVNRGYYDQPYYEHPLVRHTIHHDVEYQPHLHFHHVHHDLRADRIDYQIS